MTPAGKLASIVLASALIADPLVLGTVSATHALVSTDGSTTTGNPAAATIPAIQAPAGGIHAGAGARRVDTTTRVTGLAPGYYTVGGYTQSSGGQRYAYLSAVTRGQTEARTALPVSSARTHLSIRGVHVTDGTLTIGLHSAGPVRTSARASTTSRSPVTIPAKGVGWKVGGDNVVANTRRTS